MPSKDHSNRKRNFTFVLAAAILLIVAAAWFVQRTYQQATKPVSKSSDTVIFTIEKGESVHEVATQLSAKNLIRKSWAFEWYIRSRNARDQLKAGSFKLSSNMSLEEIVDIITSGKVATDLVTILPAQRLDQIKTSFIQKYGFSAAAVDAAFKPSLYTDNPALTDKPTDASLEGYLYPESFQKTADTNPQTIIAASLGEMAKNLTPEIRAGMSKQGLTVHQGVILASIVEQEVSKPEDRTIAAQVFIKRLRIGMSLGSDVTAYYGAVVNGLNKSVYTDTPYNTRLHVGLPPGPISNVSSSSLKAVANPADTDYLFFVSGDDGNTYFSNTQAEHDNLANLHCKKLCSED